ncbi:nuclear transport factor 2 family protein [Hymenobacter sp. 15J16-1T3B]|uniref:nuclear transport factor 2 family protein n=1 Tax=Hymenobacter sp. 15J16-1T3B TaxID=2886941 RepID=UPI001D128DE5|nr:nuclear transport factor 2 family protein [Hymenobacter sp. 15J16-1T3B]MCC3159762.1 nuclear transport factor 2 family protein [Hymenobacter sp. 15J16-1T3B]
MQQSTTESVLNNFLQNLARQDAAGIQASFADTIDWYVPGDPALPWTGARTRGSEVAAYFHTMWPHFVPGQSSASVQNLLVSGEDAVIFGTFSHTAASTGQHFQTPVALHLKVVEGKIRQLHLYEDTWLVSKALAPEVQRSSAPADLTTGGRR